MNLQRHLIEELDLMPRAYHDGRVIYDITDEELAYIIDHAIEYGKSQLSKDVHQAQ